ncbi:MAG: hypothetical protein AB7H93_19985 [Vicinamibacterales bacterium]
MEPDDLRRFARRDWAAVARSKRAFWAERYRDAGAAPARRAADALLLHARRLAAPGAAGDDRAADLASHLNVRDRLDRAARAFARR